jgi:hypothetical protein
MGKVKPHSKESRRADQAIRGKIDAGRMANRSDLSVLTTRWLVPSGPLIESALVQRQGAQLPNQKALRARKLGSIVVPPGLTDLNRSARAWRIREETTTRAKPGEVLRGNHREETQRTTVNREGPNSPRVSSDLEVNLKDQRHPILDKIGSSLPVQPGKDAGEAMAVKRETATKRSAAK